MGATHIRLATANEDLIPGRSADRMETSKSIRTRNKAPPKKRVKR